MYGACATDLGESQSTPSIARHTTDDDDSTHLTLHERVKDFACRGKILIASRASFDVGFDQGMQQRMLLHVVGGVAACVSLA